MTKRYLSKEKNEAIFSTLPAGSIHH